PDAAPPPAWHRDLPPASVMGAPRGLQPQRGIIHLHSPYSHDACDGAPRDGTTGAVDEACLADLRAALCTTRIDYAALSDHDDTMADEDFATLFSMRGDDTAVTDGDGNQIGSRIHCDDGHTVLVTVGGENPIMPIMLDHHVAGTIQERHDTYNADTPAAVAAFRAAGATVWIAHTEQRTTPELVTLQPDGIEVYQLHANLDPGIRADYLGLPAAGAITAVAEFADTGDAALEPDVALLSFLEPNTPSLDRWDEVLAMGMHVAGSGGTDAHQNALPVILRDGERGDSYRRMLRWFGNIALVTDAGDPAAIEDAVRRGRMYLAFELFGTPVGFDARAVCATATAEMGDTVGPGDGCTLEVDVPTIYQLDPSLPAPVIEARILRIDAGGPTEVARGAGPTLATPLDAAGAYRVEVTIQPRHLGPYLGHLGTDLADRVVPWIYGNPIYVE
ncbi:MAG: hypothetical protein KC464_15925, partial [Myxococcales bacterium]|nr:hypothetical protein [Myxococcales bacterium]